MELLDRMQTGRFKVFHHLRDWFEEFNLYHRKDGLIVKEGDDLLSAPRYAVMMKRYAKPGWLFEPKVGKYDRKMEEWWKPSATTAVAGRRLLIRMSCASWSL